jgi:outer membrane immunogenic protein
MNTKASLLGLLTATLLSSTAFAADVYSGKDSMKDGVPFSDTKVVNWTGFYIGGQAGYGFANHELSIREHAPGSGEGEGAIPSFNEEFLGLDGISSTGFIGGGRLGFDIARGRFLFGVFGEYNFSNIESELRIVSGADQNGLIRDTFTLEKDHEWSVGARAGVLVNPRTLAYVLAAYTQTQYDISGPGVLGNPSLNSEIEMDGVTVGTGVEYALSSNVFLGLEGTYTFYGDETVFDNRVEGFGTTADVETDELKVMGTLKIKLNSDTGLGF